MSKRRVTVVDYGIGNLQSVRRALECCDGEVVVSGAPADLAAAERVVLPGVGAFEDGMHGLRERGLVEPLISYAASGRPMLGICLGMQMLATCSEEFGLHGGLGLIAGRVVAIPRRATDGASQKVPSIGWTRIAVSHGSGGSILDEHAAEAAVYLVHSFHLVPEDRTHILATYDFGGHALTAAVRQGNVTGLQFHPEKSGPTGLAVMAKFLSCS